MPDGSTKLENLRAVAKRVTVPELDYPEPHDGAVYLLNHFWKLKQTPGVKLSYTEITNYSNLMVIKFKPFEIDTLMIIDRIFERSVGG